ncbi:formimidoylglutamase [Blastococcus sp. CT_GayMR20]|uniref:agmatinase family protein n=1 Tax=Blastococcus sp. CT_GayMR20 TaxID=2559609 RepID=UPI001072F514|nr:agmatinase family protein [Blastococcus sp. CT_GayMR20]TFV91859.1 formimidoylglutamase [Blastococcus sp. CT_GayMR20]TFV91904.1 formimidoylglutamase [Blastococcus sp. CT_GayMR20]
MTARQEWLDRHGVAHLKEPGLVLNGKFEDRHEPRIWNWLRPWDFASPFDVGIIGAGLSTTSILPTACFAAPDALRLSTPSFTTYSPDFDVDIATMVARDLGDIGMPILDQREALQRIEDTMEALWRASGDAFLVLIGGDHAVTAPAARAYARSHPGQKMGLIHFDAHNDVRVMDHGPTNGTPIRQLLESGLPFSGENLVQVGIHGFMNASYYKRWVEGHGGTIITGRQVRRAGIDAVIEEAVQIACEGTDAVYVTVDIDVLELAYGTGTGAATPEGLHPMDLYEALFALGQNPKVAAIDFVEHDPARDVSTMTGRTMTGALLTFLAGLFLRRNDGWRGYDPTPITGDDL